MRRNNDHQSGVACRGMDQGRSSDPAGQTPDITHAHALCVGHDIFYIDLKYSRTIPVVSQVSYTRRYSSTALEQADKSKHFSLRTGSQVIYNTADMCY